MAGKRLVAMLTLVALLGVLAATANPTAGGLPEPGPASPIADWLQDLIDDIEDAADDLGESEATVAEQSGPLTGADLTKVETDISNTLDVIQRIFDPAQYPSLDPTDAGEIDYGVSPTTLPDYADDCLRLIEEAVYEARFGAADDDYIGSRLKTIEHLINRAHPHNYKSKAGVQ